MVVGASLGGLNALKELLSGLPAGFRTPIAIAQHRLPGRDESLAEYLQPNSALPVSEPVDKTPIEPGQVYVAPADYHLLVECGWFALSTEGRVSHARPSVDVLFESAAASYGREVLGVVLTGASDDGADGAAAVRRHGGLVVVQDPAQAQASIMPVAAAVVGRADVILALEDIADFLTRACASELRARD